MRQKLMVFILFNFHVFIYFFGVYCHTHQCDRSKKQIGPTANKGNPPTIIGWCQTFHHTIREEANTSCSCNHSNHIIQWETPRSLRWAHHIHPIPTVHLWKKHNAKQNLPKTLKHHNWQFKHPFSWLQIKQHFFSYLLSHTCTPTLHDWTLTDTYTTAGSRN